MAARSYGQRCAVAHALDIVGQRWGLLIVRELLLGPKRFTDLRAGLPQASRNVMAQRLRELQHVGVLRRHRLPPPASSWVYELTEWGRQLEPTLAGLVRWGTASPFLPADGMLSADSAALGLRVFFDSRDDTGWQAVCELRLGADRFTARVERGQINVERGSPAKPDVVIEADPSTFTGFLGNPSALSAAVHDGHASVNGSMEVALRIVRAASIPSGTA
jgi:DNA-binding HxlR family transcriptional regulator